MSDDQIRALWERAKREGDKRIARLCDAALDDWYFSPSTREWARRKLAELETP